MTDYRDQAIKDVAQALGETVEALQLMLSNPAENDFSPEEYQYRYAVTQREARLRLEDALRDVIFASAGLVDEAYLREARAALEAVKEK